MNSGFQIAPPFRLVNGRHGCMLVNPNDKFVGRAILTYGEYGELEFQFLSQLMVKPGSVVEIGAHAGALTVPLARMAAQQQRKLIAFEPQPVIFQNLCANLALGGLMNVRALPFACGRKSETLYFSPPDYLAEGNFGGVSLDAGGEGMAVPSVAADDVLGEERVALVKLDVEGMEREALEGLSAVLTQSRPVLYLEDDRPEKSRSLIEWLWEREYRLWWHMSPLFNPGNFFGVRQNIYPNLVSCNLLGLPRERQTEVADLREVTDAGWHPFEAAPPRGAIFEDDDA